MTELLYLVDMQLCETTANVVAVHEVEGRTDVLLDQTNFYPQGGGQPADRGRISAGDATFVVDDVRFADGTVHHFGRFENGHFDAAATVMLDVDSERRAVMSRNHSAGHVVDMAVDALGLGWIPGKGYHFPKGPYVEYTAELSDSDRDRLKSEIEEKANQFVAEAIATSIRFASRGELASLCRFVPDYVPADKPSRVVLYGTFGVPCGGTHVANLHDIGNITIRKIKASGNTVRVSYAV